MPLSFAWSSPGAALLIAAHATTHDFSAAVGAFVVCGVLIAVTGLWPALTRAITRIPTPIASAMLAGILFPICLAPVEASVQAAAARPADRARLAGALRPRAALGCARARSSSTIVVVGHQRRDRMVARFSLVAPHLSFVRADIPAARDRRARDPAVSRDYGGPECARFRGAAHLRIRESAGAHHPRRARGC